MSGKKITSNFGAAKKFVEMKRGHGQESLSGPGSWLANTSESVAFINEAIARYDVQSILDLGCGDWNWFHTVERGTARYEGWDADEQMVADNRQRYGDAQTQFLVKDIVTADYPDVDLILCRDVLFHMMPDVAQAILSKVRDSKALFISTSFRDVKENVAPVKYTDFDNWGYYDINLNVSPFNLAQYEVAFVEEKANGNAQLRRYICLYDFRQA